MKTRKQKEECLEVLRGLVGGFEEGLSGFDYAAGATKHKAGTRRFLHFARRLIQQRDDIAQFIERDMDLLSPEERYRLYVHIPGFLPAHLASILRARLSAEQDERCLLRLRQIAAIPCDEASKVRAAREATERYRASEELRQHDSPRPEHERVERMHRLSQVFRSHASQSFDKVDILVAFCLQSEPKDRDLFFKAIQGLSDGEIQDRKDTSANIIDGLMLFGAEERAQRLLAMKARLGNQ